jgi:hypothetical protein
LAAPSANTTIGCSIARTPFPRPDAERKRTDVLSLTGATATAYESTRSSMRAGFLLVAAGLVLQQAPARAITLSTLCKRACATVAADCRTKPCKREVMRKCHLEGPQFCLPICTPGDGTGSGGGRETTTTTTPTTPGETSTTTLPPIGLQVDDVTHEVYLGAPELVVTVTVTNTSGASDVNLSPYNFSLRQSGATHTISIHTAHLLQRCSVSVVLAANASSQCAVAFELVDDGTQRTLEFQYGLGLAPVSITF